MTEPDEDPARGLAGQIWLDPHLLEQRLAGIAVLALGIDGFEEVVRGDTTLYLRQSWLCRDLRK
jgi:hypothetical protein